MDSRTLWGAVVVAASVGIAFATYKYMSRGAIDPAPVAPAALGPPPAALPAVIADPLSGPPIPVGPPGLLRSARPELEAANLIPCSQDPARKYRSGPGGFHLAVYPSRCRNDRGDIVEPWESLEESMLPLSATGCRTVDRPVCERGTGRRFANACEAMAAGLAPEPSLKGGQLPSAPVGPTYYTCPSTSAESVVARTILKR
eukprot:tig00000492_g1500.t1